MPAQRTVSVGLIANVNGYIANMNRAAEATRKTAAATIGSEKQLRAQAEVYGKVGAAALAGGAIAAAGLALVVKATADYGAKMAQLQSLSKASRAEMAQLSKAAMEQGRAYGFTASQVADAQIELVKAGFDTKQILGGGLKAALSLAAAGQMDVADATSITTIALTQFKLKASDLPHVADLLAAGADKALGSVADLGAALSNGGSQAAAMGMSIQDTIGVLSAFANAGTIGAEAGTQLRSLLLQLQNPSAKSKKTMDELGISVYDASGKFVGMTNFAGQLQEKLGGLTQAQQNAAKATIFGSYAVNGANVLIREGSKGIAEWTARVNEYGFANAQAAGKLDSLSGDVTKLSAAFDTNLIKAGSGANDVLRGITQSGTALLDVVGDIPQPVLSIGVALTAGAAGVGLLGGAALIAVPKILLFRRELAEAGISGKAFARTFGKGSAVLLGIGAATAGFLAMSQTGTASTQQLALSADSLGKSWKGVDQLFSKAGNALNAGAGLKNSLDELSNGDAAWTKWLDGASGGLLHLSDVYKSNEGQLAAIGEQFAGLAKQDFSAATSSFRGLVNAQRLSADQTNTLLKAMPAYRDYLVEVATKAKVAATDQNLVAIAQGKGAVAAKVLAAQNAEAAAAAAQQTSALNSLAGAADDGTTSISALKNAIEGLDGGELSARDAARGFEQAIDDATAAAKKNGHTLDITTQAGRDNQAALDGIATAAQKSAEAYLDAGGNAAGASRIIRDGRKAYIDAAIQMGASRAEAKKLADALFNLPKVTKVQVGVDGIDTAKATLAELQAKLGALNGMKATVMVNAIANGVSIGQAAQQGKNAAQNAGFADGGAVNGPGPKGQDSVDAKLAPGEHVLTADDVDAMGGQSGVYTFRAQLHMAKGGEVNAITDATRAASKADADARKYAAQVKAARKAAAAAQKTYDDIDGTKANRAAKKSAKARKDAADDRVTTLEKKLSDARDTRSKSNDAAKQLRFDREDFVSTQRRATADNTIDSLSYIDDLRSMSRDDNYSAAKRKKFADTANQYEKQLVDLTTKSKAAADGLAKVKDSSDQMSSSIASSIAGRYTSADAGSLATTSGWTVQDGMRFQSTTSSISAASLDAYWANAATDSGAFASQLKELAARGVNGTLLAQIAQDAKGPELAAALLSADQATLQRVNANFAATQGNAADAGQTVADYNFKALIDDAQANADKITASINDTSALLRKVIVDAFGLKGKGYAVGTPSATPGLHPVGEQGAELVTGPGLRLFRGGEKVYTRGQTQVLMRGGGAAAARARSQQMQVSMPSEMQLVDASGDLISRLRVEARGVATQVFHTEMDAGAVRLIGA